MAMNDGVMSVLVQAMTLGGASLLQIGCAEHAQGGGSVSDERIAVTQAAGDDEVSASLGGRNTIVVRSSEVLASGGDVAVALFPGACAWPAGNPLPVETLYPSGVLTWALRGGTVFQKGHFCEFGKARLIMQPDGNLVVYDESNRARWASNTVGTGHHARFQPDGDFVVYNASDRPLWASNTRCSQGCNLHVQEDGNVVIYAPGWQPRWATNTSH